MGNSMLMLAYLLASISFIVGLKMLSHPETAKKGNLIAGVGMSIAILATIFLYEEEGQTLGNYGWIFSGLLIGSVIGWMAAKKVQMTAMPEMVSLFNGMGGACAALISLVEFAHLQDMVNIMGGSIQVPGALDVLPDEWKDVLYSNKITPVSLWIIVAGLVIGSVSFAGSMVAWGKLRGKIKDIRFKGQQALSLLMLGMMVLMAILLWWNASIIGADSEADLLTNAALFYGLFAVALLYGVFFVLPIGGADMPVVISLLNSFTGVAAACGGFLYENKAMLTGGILVGAAGTLLTILMCRAMNRSLKNVLLGSFGATGAQAVQSGEQGSYKEISLNDAAMMMNYAERVMIVPGYGLAVAQAQHACHELEKLLSARGVEVGYAIHPVAGRMPGHMNVLLAEADVPYEKLLEMESANELFPRTDVVLVLGANDVVNPAAKSDPASPIYGMPILEVELAKQVIVNKRSMKPGYAGIENELFFKPKTSMLFGDAKKVLQELVAALKDV